MYVNGFICSMIICTQSLLLLSNTVILTKWLDHMFVLCTQSLLLLSNIVILTKWLDHTVCPLNGMLFAWHLCGDNI